MKLTIFKTLVLFIIAGVHYSSSDEETAELDLTVASPPSPAAS